MIITQSALLKKSLIAAMIFQLIKDIINVSKLKRDQ